MEKDVIEKAVEYFGLTDKITEAGYILVDGRMLDFSGKNFGGCGDCRVMDHREIGIVMSYLDNWDDFIKSGNIRMDYNTSEKELILDIEKEPTSEQYNQIYKLLIITNGKSYIELFKNGEHKPSFTKEYIKGSVKNTVIEDIKEFYNNNKTRFSRDIEMFRENTKTFSEFSLDILNIPDSEDVEYIKAKNNDEFEIENIVGVITDKDEIKKIEKSMSESVLDANLTVNDVKRGDVIYITALLKSKESYSWNANKLSVLKVRIVDIYSNMSILDTVKLKK